MGAWGGALDWLAGLKGVTALNTAGPRESQPPGVYTTGRAFLERFFAQAPLV
jgi:hypothetical protein